MSKINEGKRFGGADWADQIKDITIIGVGGIGSWTALNLSRVGHPLFLIDDDIVDETNVTGGQMYRIDDVGLNKAACISQICREFGATSSIDVLSERYNKDSWELDGIVICAVDNMSTRKESFEEWLKNEKGPSLYIDGRLTMEMFEIFCIQRDKEHQIKEYTEKYLFSDSEVEELPCSVKQSTFSAMGIASSITACLCNWLTNQKIEAEFREVPFYTRMYYPIIDIKKQDIESSSDEIGKVVVEEDATRILPKKSKAKVKIKTE